MLRELLFHRPPGRGRNFTILRGIWEKLLRAAHPFDWSGRLWNLVPGSDRVCVVRESLPFFPTTATRAPLRIAFVSDLHVGPTTPAGVLDRAFECLRELAPDLLLLGGDYVFLDATDRRLIELADRVQSVPAKWKLAVLGNHDLWTDHGKIERALERAGVQVLVNQCARLPAPYEDVGIVGLDDPWAGSPDLQAALEHGAAPSLRIGLCHSPESLPLFQGSGVRVLFCGHTHGGQIALPGRRPLYCPGRLGQEYSAGLFELEEFHLFVSRGVGSVVLPMRFFAPADVALFTLT